MRTLWVLAFLLLQGAVIAGEPAPVAPASSEKCAVMFEVNGKEVVQTLSSLHVANAEPTAPFVLPKDAPPGVSVIICARATLIPAKYDYKVLLAGHPLAIIAPDNRKAILELSSENVILYRMVQGASSNEESLSVQESLQANQQLLTKTVGK